MRRTDAAWLLLKIIFTMKRIFLTTLCAIAISHLAAAEGGLQLTKQPLVLEEGGEVTRFSVRAGGSEFYFLPPRGWKMTLDDAEQKVILAARDGAAQLSFKILCATDGKSPQLDVAELRTQIRGRFHEARITEEFIAHASTASGPAFDLTYATARNFTFATRVAFIPFASGTVEFQLTTRPENFSQNHIAFGGLLNSFQIEPATKAVVQSKPFETTAAIGRSELEKAK